MKGKTKKAVVSAGVLAVCSVMTAMSASADDTTGYSTADSVWSYRAVANVEVSVNIRAYASEDSQVVGYLTKAASADVIEKGETWSLVISNGVEGYVKNEYLAFGEEAQYLASVYGMPGVKTYWDGVSLFSAPDGNSQILATVNEGQEYEVISNDGTWVAVQMDDATMAYVPAEDVMETTILDRAVSTQSSSYDTGSTGTENSYSGDAGYTESYEDSYYSDSYSDSSYEESYDSYSDTSYQESYDDSYSDTSYQESYEDSYSDTSYQESYEDSYSDTSYQESYEDSYSDTSYQESYDDSYTDTSGQGSSSYEASSSDRELLAALIYCEAGNQSRDGKVAVGAVVMNRVASGSFPGSIREVIYQSGQFSPAGSGWMDSVITSGAIPSDCYEAADAAMAGENPVGGAMYFNTGSGKGIKIGAHQFY